MIGRLTSRPRLRLGSDHLSCYGLSFEKGTRLDSQRRRGEVTPLDDGVEREMFAHTMRRLESHGLRQYEISNYSRPGHESVHNLSYWANDAYFGFGLGAARYVRGVRSINTRDLAAYLKRVEAGADPTGPIERLEPEPRTPGKPPCSCSGVPALASSGTTSKPGPATALMRWLQTRSDETRNSAGSTTTAKACASPSPAGSSPTRSVATSSDIPPARLHACLSA